MAKTKNLTITKGDTYTLVVRWETSPIVRKAITGISFASGAPRLTVPGHGCVNGWDAAVAMVKGPTALNAVGNPPSESDYHPITLIDANTVEFNDITPVDDNGREWPEYVSGGFLLYNTPVDLSGYTARMKIKDRVGGTVIASTESGDAPDNVLTVTIDNTAKTITLTIAATATEDIIRKSGVYDLEMVSAAGAVTKILAGSIAFGKEVTTP